VRQALGKEINQRKLQEVVSGERSNVMEQLRQSSEAAVEDLGIQIIDVRIKRIDLPEAVSDSVYKRMRAERKRVANELRSTGTERSETIRADADRQRQILVAEAERDANRLRGEGEAAAAEIYAKSYQHDPDFYAFYRNLEAYRVSLKGKDTVLLLDPKSEFFKYFEEGTK
jgi:membrane protease subunit HflC